MSYPQTLIRKRRVRGPMDELLPDGSTVLEALQRLQRPSMAPVLAEQPPVMPDVPTRMIVPPVGNPATGVDAVPPPNRTLLTFNKATGAAENQGSWPVTELLNEPPLATIRRDNINQTWRQGKDTGYDNPVSAVMPVSAATGTPLYSNGYGAGYERTVLDPSVRSGADSLPVPAGLIRPRLAVPPIGNEINVPDTQLLTRPTQPYVADNRGVAVGAPLPPEMIADTSLVRPRMTAPVDALQRAAENYNASMSSQPFYGTDSEGNQLTHAKRGFLGRLGAAAKRFGYGMLRGQGVIGSGLDAIEGAVNPDINAQERLQRTRMQNAGELSNQIQIAGERAKLGQIQANTDWLKQRPEIEGRKAKVAALKQDQQNIARILSRLLHYKRGENPEFDSAIDAAKMTIPDFEGKPGQRKLVYDEDGKAHLLGQDGTLAPLPQLDDPSKATIEVSGPDGQLYRVKPGSALNAASTAAGRSIAQSDKSVEDTNRINDVTDNNAVIDSQISRKQQDLQAAQAELYGLEQASKAVGATGIVVEDSAKLDAARKKVQGIQDDIGALQRQKKVVPLPRSQATSPRGKSVAPTSGIIRYQ